MGVRKFDSFAAAFRMVRSNSLIINIFDYWHENCLFLQGRRVAKVVDQAASMTRTRNRDTARRVVQAAGNALLAVMAALVPLAGQAGMATVDANAIIYAAGLQSNVANGTEGRVPVDPIEKDGGFPLRSVTLTQKLL